jgi:hypothetical protein
VGPNGKNADLALARARLRDAQLGMVVVRDGETVWESAAPGVASLLDAVENEARVRGAALADRVVGRAVALVAVHGAIAAVHGEVMSEPAVAVLRSHGTLLSYDRRVQFVHNRAGTGLCPLEQLTAPIDSPSDALIALREFTRRGGPPS